MERRKADIEAKRAKLAELRKAREDRRSTLLPLSASTLSSSAVSPVPGGSSTASGRSEAGGSDGSRPQSRVGGAAHGGVDDIVAGLLRERQSARAAAEQALRASTSTVVPAAAERAESVTGSASVERGTTPVQSATGSEEPPQGVAVGTSTDGLPLSASPLPPPPAKKAVITYDKGVQTSLSDSDATRDQADGDDGIAVGSSTPLVLERTKEEESRLKAQLLAELEEEKRSLDLQIATEAKKLEEERFAVALEGQALVEELESEAFRAWLERSSTVLERAMGAEEGWDLLRDYRAASDGARGAEDEGREKVRLRGTWYDPSWGKGRSVTALAWSDKFKELCVASYSKNPQAVRNEPDGVVAVWNLHLMERPEFLFHSQSDILSVAVSPFQPHLIIGGSYSGQIQLWDTRSRHPNPVLKTPLSATGHTHPVYSLSLVGTQNAHNLMSASTDGVVCSWALDMLAKPQELLELVHPAHAKTNEVSVTAMGFAEGEAATFYVGTEEGNVYPANRHDRAGAKAGLVQSEPYRGHLGPVTALDFHPRQQGASHVDLSDLFLTSGVDWTVKLWRAGSAISGGASSSKAAAPSLGASVGGAPQPLGARPLLSFEDANDYVFDVKWHPRHPAAFGTVDGSGTFALWNLNIDTEVPAATASLPASRGLNKLAWDADEGRRAAAGGADGKVYVFDCAPQLVTPNEGDWDALREVVSQQQRGEVV